jgi:hypothetical protein
LKTGIENQRLAKEDADVSLSPLVGYNWIPGRTKRASDGIVRFTPESGHYSALHQMSAFSQ